MIRFWMVAILLTGMTSGVTEARDRQRFSSYQGGSGSLSRPCVTQPEQCRRLSIHRAVKVVLSSGFSQ